MDFRYFTPTESERLHCLQVKLVDILSQFSQEEHPIISDGIDRLLYLECHPKIVDINKEKDKIYDTAFLRFKKYVSEHKEEYISQINEFLSLYTDSIGVSFLFEIFEKYGESAYKNHAYNELKTEITNTLYSICYPYCIKVEDTALIGIFSYIDRSIDEKIKRIINECDNRIEKSQNAYDLNNHFFLACEETVKYGSDPSGTKVDAVVPRSHIIPNNTLMNALHEGVKHKDGRPASPIINAGHFDLVVSNGYGKRKELTTYTIVSFDSEETGIELKIGKISEYERQVVNAICSIWDEATQIEKPTVFTLDMIYRAMPGGGAKASSQQKELIKQSIKKLSNLKIETDVTEELIARKIIQPGEECIHNDRFFSITDSICRTKNGGKEVIGYELDKEPLILRYSRQTKQLLTLNMKCLKIQILDEENNLSGQPIKMNVDRQAITGYLLRQIAWIKHDHNSNKKNKRSDIILFDSIFNDAGINTESRTIEKRNRDFVFSVLDYEAAIGYIDGYEKKKEGRKIRGVRILLKKRERKFILYN